MSAMPVGGLVPQATDDAAELVVRNASIHTGDPRRPHAEALAVRGGVITVVGDDKDVAPHVGPATKVSGPPRRWWTPSAGGWSRDSTTPTCM